MKRLVEEIKNEIVESFNNGELMDYVSDNAIAIKKTDSGCIKHIVFTLGGPYVYLDFVERSGVVCCFESISDAGSFSAIPLLVWEDIEIELEEYFMEVA